MFDRISKDKSRIVKNTAFSFCTSNEIRIKNSTLILLYNSGKIKNKLFQCTSSGEHQTTDLSFLDPGRTCGVQYSLVLRSDHKLCPQIVKRCQQCKREFTTQDKLVIKSYGDRGDYTNKSGEIVPSEGNLYLHFLTNCLQQWDKNFEFGKVVVPKSTREKIPEEWKPSLKNTGIKI